MSSLKPIRENGHLSICSKLGPVEKCSVCANSYAMAKPGNFYYIKYEDMNYPCNCGCHTNGNIMHIVPCCQDNSYDGIAYLVAITECHSSFFLKPKCREWLNLGPMSVMRPTDETFELNQDAIDYLLGKINENFKISKTK